MPTRAQIHLLSSRIGSSAELSADGHNGVVQIQGEKWREQRRFSLHALRDFGVGRALMEEKIWSEVAALIGHLEVSVNGVELKTLILKILKYHSPHSVSGTHMRRQISSHLPHQAGSGVHS